MLLHVQNVCINIHGIQDKPIRIVSIVYHFTNGFLNKRKK